MQEATEEQMKAVLLEVKIAEVLGAFRAAEKFERNTPSRMLANVLVMGHLGELNEMFSSQDPDLEGHIEKFVEHNLAFIAKEIQSGVIMDINAKDQWLRFRRKKWHAPSVIKSKNLAKLDLR